MYSVWCLSDGLSRTSSTGGSTVFGAVWEPY